MNTLRRWSVLSCFAIVGACSTSPVPAPVEVRGRPSSQVEADKAGTPSPARNGYYTVRKGDTLYSIALDHGQDYKDIASWNSLDNPNVIKVGQQLRVAPPEEGAPVAVAKPVTTSGPVEVRNVGSEPVPTKSDGVKREPKGGKLPWSEDSLAKARKVDESQRQAGQVPRVAEKAADQPDKSAGTATEKAVVDGSVEWMWPATGKLLSGFSEGGSKGLDIGGKTGDSVHAAAAGTVSYAGSGLRGYGNLVVLRHSSNLLSVYAHNSKLLVKEKEVVSKGQKIAEIGSSDAASPRLHFEIRRQGKPVDPLQYLPSR